MPGTNKADNLKTLQPPAPALVAVYLEFILMHVFRDGSKPCVNSRPESWKR